jgi:diguanylate cyclase (GGDEF)-like protein/PAS domain S-box-containing protein/putative nucleotidyltransferase with HDIG domain
LKEQDRLQALESYRILDTVPEKDFDEITQLAAHTFQAPICIISFVDEHRTWFKAHFGIDKTEAPRDITFCDHTMRVPDIFIVPDAARDPRFAENPFVVGEPYVRFYAGVPLITQCGHVLGALSVIDTKPRECTAEQIETLTMLGRVVMTQLELRRVNRENAVLIEQQTANEKILRVHKEELQRITDNAPTMIARVDCTLHYTFANRAYEDILGIPRDSVVGRSVREVVGERPFEVVKKYIERAFEGECVSYEAELDYPVAGRHAIHVSYAPEFDESGNVTGIVLAATDITHRKRTEHELLERTEVLTNILSTIPHHVFWKDRNSVYLGCNANYARAAGLSSPEEIIGKTDFDLPWTPEEAEEYREFDRHVMESGEPVTEREERYNGDPDTYGLTSKVPLHDADGKVVGILGITQDITDRKMLEAERERLFDQTQRLLAEAIERSNRDSLTGLLNHRAFHNQLEVEAERAVKTGKPLAVVMMDLDNFKFFNDAYGHRAGDDVIRLIASVLGESCRPGDCLARFGGDEFAMLLPGVNRTEAARIMERMTSILDRRGYIPPGASNPIPVRISVGIAVYPNEASTRLEAIEFADTRLRLAKGGADDSVLAADLIRNTMKKRVKGFSMLDALVAAVDNKDRYTRRHSEEVLAYSIDICRELGLDEAMQHDTAVAALLHDVGKIGVPDPILRKPGRLSDEEFEIIKQHVTMGAIIVQAVPGFEVTLDAIRLHHERWDGTGYPDGLRGHEIPLMARVIGVADAFSAMTTDRPYRKGMTPERALEILSEGIGTQWDEECVAALARSRRKHTVQITPVTVHAVDSPTIDRAA